jgi:hypothetical protein
LVAAASGAAALLVACAAAGPTSSAVSGPGWNLVREGGHARQPGPLVALAGTAPALAGTWPFSDGKPPSSLGTSVRVRFTTEVGGCDVLRLRRVVINVPAQLIYPIIEVTAPKGTCTKAPAAYSHVVTIARKALPAAPFTVQSTEDLSGDPREVITVTADQVGVAAPETDGG